MQFRIIKTADSYLPEEKGRMLLMVRAHAWHFHCPNLNAQVNLTWYSSGKFCKRLLAVSTQHLVRIPSCKQTIHAKACGGSPWKCFSRESWRLACVLAHSWLAASCFLVRPVIAPPRRSSSAEWYLRHKLLRFSWVELMLLCWLWSSFCIS